MVYRVLTRDWVRTNGGRCKKSMIMYSFLFVIILLIFGYL